MISRSYRSASFNIIIFMICLIMMFLSACTAPSPTPTDQTLPERQYPDLDAYKQKSEATQVSLIKILMAEAEKFLWQQQYQDALFVYNQALNHANEAEAREILMSVERALQAMPAKEIEEFSLIQKIQIPRPLLNYWLGVNYGLENNTQRAAQILTDFVAQYPDHRYAQDAKQLVEIMSISFFNRETIGCLLPLSGKYAVFGNRALAGIRLAVQDLNQQYHKNFKLIIRDTKADPAVAVQAVREFHIRNVSGIIGPLLVPKEAGLEAQKLGIPMIALTQKNDFPLSGDYLFNNFITPEMQVKTLGSYLFNTLGIKKVAILYPNEKYGQTYMNLFWDVTSEYGARIVGVEPYNSKNTDFTVPIRKLTGEFYPIPEELIPEEPELSAEESNPDNPALNPDEEKPEEDESGRGREKEKEKIEIDFEALFIPDSPKTVKLILPQLAFNDATGMYIVGTNLWHHKILLRDARGYNKQAVITDGFFDKSQNPRTAEFSSRFKSMFGNTPGFLEAISYDAANLLLETALDERVDSRAALKDQLLNRDVYSGVTGDTVFDQNGAAQRNLFLMTIKKGKFVEISR